MFFLASRSAVRSAVVSALAFWLSLLNVAAAVAPLHAAPRRHAPAGADAGARPASDAPAKASDDASRAKGSAAPSEASAAADVLASLPLAFEPNRGQTDGRVSYLARAAGYALFLTAEGAVMSFGGAPARDKADDVAHPRRDDAEKRPER